MPTIASELPHFLDDLERRVQLRPATLRAYRGDLLAAAALLPGDVFANRRPAPVLQQLEHRGSQDVSVNDCFRPVSVYWDRINRPEHLSFCLRASEFAFQAPSF